jgi:retinal rod rhodopsin-sensitive cGMP 3',5'-cyclic phosphodiesterase subunit delta
MEAKYADAEDRGLSAKRGVSGGVLAKAKGIAPGGSAGAGTAGAGNVGTAQAKGRPRYGLLPPIGIASEGSTTLAEDAEGERQVEAEWEALRRKKKEGEIKVSSDATAQSILRGFRINSMRMRDAVTGRLMWVSGDWGDDMFEQEKIARVPASILNCRAVAREVNFSSDELMENFRLEQRVFFQGVCMEEWFFKFGFVIPGSTNNWEQTIYAADRSAMLPAHMLSGNITIETSFFDGDLFVSSSVVRIFYDGKEPCK